MTEAEWLACRDPLAMLRHLWPEPVTFAQPAAPPSWFRNRPAWSRTLRLFLLHAYPRGGHTKVFKRDLIYADCATATADVDLLYSHWLAMSDDGRPFADPAGACALLRELVGGPGGPPEVRREVLWHPTVMHLAAAVYCDVDRCGRYDALGVLALADALEEAGCEAWHPILMHLRGWERCGICYEERPGRKCVCWGVGTDGEPIPAFACHICHGTGRIDDGTLDPFRLALLADALEEAGCAEGVAGEAAMLTHLRGRHVRGCWAVDLAVGR